MCCKRSYGSLNVCDNRTEFVHNDNEGCLKDQYKEIRQRYNHLLFPANQELNSVLI